MGRPILLLNLATYSARIRDEEGGGGGGGAWKIRELQETNKKRQSTLKTEIQRGKGTVCVCVYTEAVVVEDSIEVVFETRGNCTRARYGY